MTFPSVILAVYSMILRLVSYQIFTPGSDSELPYDLLACSYFMAILSVFISVRQKAFKTERDILRGVFRVFIFCEGFDCIKEIAGTYSVKIPIEYVFFWLIVLITSTYSIYAYYSTRK